MPEPENWPRFVPEEPYPPYSYFPGSGRPHPLTDAAGHALGRSWPSPGPIEPARWWESRAYLHGLDLWNHGDFWEAHERWESLWRAHDRRGDVADHLRALIKLAAAGVKQREGIVAGVRTHAGRAAEIWRRLILDQGPQATFLGLRLTDLIALADTIQREGRLPANWRLAPVDWPPGA